VKLLDTLLLANNLKATPRSGWVMRGVPEAESVADHTCGVAFLALALAEAAGAEATFERGRLLSMALLHDLAESLTGDLPRPAQRFFPAGAKRQAEQTALQELLAGLPATARETLLALRAEYEERASAEARLVHDADRLDTLLQAYVYAQRTGNRVLGEFWQGQVALAPFHFEVSQNVYAALKRRQEME
jgi:putative hydrolase of HD superfamily